MAMIAAKQASPDRRSLAIYELAENAEPNMRRRRMCIFTHMQLYVYVIVCAFIHSFIHCVSDLATTLREPKEEGENEKSLKPPMATSQSRQKQK